MISALMLENLRLLPLSPWPQTPPSIRIILYSEQNYPIISAQIHSTMRDIISVFKEGLCWCYKTICVFLPGNAGVVGPLLISEYNT